MSDENPVPETAATPESLAARWIEARGRGENPDAAAMARKLPTDADREAFHRLVRDVGQLQDLMPVQVREGTVLSERYRILHELGRGGMGRVFEAQDTWLERRVAVKVLAASGAQAFDPEQLFHKEAVLLASLQHPNIVAVHEIARHGDVDYLVMDLVRGVSLGDVLEAVRERLEEEDQPYPRRGDLLSRALSGSGRGDTTTSIDPLVDEASWFRTVARIVRVLAMTVESAHEAGVVHRDLKPQNVILRPDGSPVILDFGLAGARDAEGGEVTRSLVGSVAYLAPEQTRSGQVGSDPRSDVYQLGVILYEMLTLCRAFDGGTMSELLGRISEGNLMAPRRRDAGIPFELEAICLKALAPEPVERYQSPQELREDLDRFLGGVEVPRAARGGRLAYAWRATRYGLRRHKLVSLAAATLLFGATATWMVVGDETTTEVRTFRSTSFDPDDEEGKLEFEGQFVSVEAGDYLGVEVTSEVPVFVYVLSAWIDSEGKTMVAPMRPRANDPASLAELREDDPEAPHEGIAFERHLLPGTHELLCTEITVPEDVDDLSQQEGLLVYTSPSSKPWVRRWLKELEWAGRGQGVSWETAQQALRNPWSVATAPRVRGGGIPEPTTAERDLLARRLAAARSLEADWELDDPERYLGMFPVAK